MNLRRLLARLASGKLNNVAFRDARMLVEAFGFDLARTEAAITSSDIRWSSSW